MKRLKTRGKRVVSLIIIVLLLLFGTYTSFIHGENAKDIIGTFQEVGNTDKQSSTVTLDVATNTPDAKILKIVLPNGEIIENVSTVTYDALENKEYSFEVYYSIVNNDGEIPIIEEKQITLQYAVTEIEVTEDVTSNETIEVQPEPQKSENIQSREANPEADFTFTSGKITKYKGTGTEVVIPDTIDGQAVTTIGTKAFYNNKTVKSITIPSSVTTIENGSSDSYGNISGAFSNCTALTSVNISGPISRIGDYAFYSCGTLKIIQNETPITSVGKGAFQSCTYLASVNLGTLTSIDVASFRGAKYLTEPIQLGSTIVSIPDSAFSQCFRLEGINCVTPITSIGKNSFTDCEKITTIKLGNVTSIPDSAFENCHLLSNITLPETLITIGNRAFYYSGFNSIRIPNSVTSIGTDAFSAQRSSGGYSYKTGKMIYTFPDYIEMSKVTAKGSNVVIDSVTRTAHIKDDFPMFSYLYEIGNAAVTANMVVTVNLEAMKYKVIFKDYDGITILEEVSVEDGGDATITNVPTRTGYTFIGWDGTTEEVYEDKFFIAQYKVLPVVSAQDVTIKKGESFDALASITASDADGLILSDITITSGSIDTTVLGEHIITYLVKDKWGGETSGSYRLTIQEKEIDNPDIDNPDIDNPDDPDVDNPDNEGGDKPTPPKDNVTPDDKDENFTPNKDDKVLKTSDETKGTMYAFLALTSLICVLVLVLKARHTQIKNTRH